MTPAELFHSHIDLASILAKKWQINGYDADDLIQEGLIALWIASERYDPSRGTSFATYASVCINNRYRDLARKSKKTISTVPLDSVVKYDDIF